MQHTESFEVFAAMEPAVARSLLPGWLTGHVQLDDPAALQREIELLLDGTSDDELRRVFAAFAALGTEYRFYEADPFARTLSRRFIPFLVPGAVVEGLDHLRAALSAGPTLLLSNHLSYVDTQVKDALLVLDGAAELADRLLAVAGPKVYGTPFRRMASLGLSTLKTAQSSSLSHNEAGLSPREVGRIAVETVHRAEQAMLEGRPVLVYAEGARSRSGRLQPFLKGVNRYAANPAVSVVPVSISGTDRVYPIDSPVMLPGRVRLVMGEPVPASLGRKESVEECWRRVALGLDERHRPEAETPALL